MATISSPASSILTIDPMMLETHLRDIVIEPRRPCLKADPAPGRWKLNRWLAQRSLQLDFLTCVSRCHKSHEFWFGPACISSASRPSCLTWLWPLLGQNAGIRCPLQREPCARSQSSVLVQRFLDLPQLFGPGSCGRH